MKTYLALNTPQLTTDPDIDKIFGFIMLGLLAIALAMSLYYFVPLLVTRYRNKQTEKAKAESQIWFDTHKSILHKGSQKVSIPETSLEYYVCKLVFNNPKVYQDDWSVLQAANEPDKKDRAVYYAVDRVNNKARRAFNLKDKLLKRNGERTRLNDNYY